MIERTLALAQPKMDQGESGMSHVLSLCKMLYQSKNLTSLVSLPR